MTAPLSPTLLAALLVVATAAPSSAQSPANDDCSGALAVAPGSTAFDSTLATDGAGLALDPLVCDMGPFGDEQLYQDVWFSFAPAATTNYDLAVVNSGNPTFDSRIAVYDQASCPDDPANVLACDDDSGPGNEAAVSLVPLSAGSTYLIRVGSYDPTTVEQPAALTIALSAPPPANDDCASPVAAALGTTPFDARSATTGPDLALDPVVCDMGPFGDEQIHHDVWFVFTPAASGAFDVASVDNGNSAYDSRLAIYDATSCPADPANVIACDDDSGPGNEAAVTSVPLTSGVTYLVRIGSFSEATVAQPAALSIAPASPAPANDDCSNALAVGLGLTAYDARFATDGTGQALDPVVCDMGSAGDEQLYQDVWFTFTAPATDSYDLACVNNGNPTYDSRLAVYDQVGCPDDPANVIACDDDSGPGLEAATLSVPLTGGVTYLLRLGSFGPTTGEQPAALSISASTPPPPRPSNDDCANALPVGLGSTPFDSSSATDGSGLPLDAMVCDLGIFGDEQIYQDVWFSFTPASSGPYDLGAVANGGTQFDSRIAVYDQSACPDDPANVVACDDDSGPGLQAAVSNVALSGGSTYLVRVGSYSPSTQEQPAELSIAASPLTPPNDDCANAQVVTAYGLYAFDNGNATTDGPDLAGLCDYGLGDDVSYADVWFEFTAPESGCVYVSTLNLAGFDTRLAVFDTTTCPVDPAQVLACSDEEVQGPITSPFEAGMDVLVTAGSTYLVQLGNFGSTAIGGPGMVRFEAGPQAFANDMGAQPGAPPCIIDGPFASWCNGDGGDQMGCTDCPCTNNAAPGTVGGCLNSAGSATQLAASGDPSVSLPAGDVTDLRFSLANAPGVATSVLLSGGAVAPLNMANPCFGLGTGSQAFDRDGLRCAVQSVLRHGNRQTNASGEIMDSTGPSRVWGGEAQPNAGIAGAAGFLPGQTRFFQVTHRDDPMAVCMRGLNTSQAVEVTFVP